MSGGGRWEASEVGSPQGGVISPLIANIYLDAFDQWAMSRGYRIVRYADDILTHFQQLQVEKRVEMAARPVKSRGCKIISQKV